jgi:hypothetical protein
LYFIAEWKKRVEGTSWQAAWKKRQKRESMYKRESHPHHKND